MVSAEVSTGGVILVVESPSVRNLIGTVLEKEGFATRLEDVPQGQEALTQQHPQVDLLITNEPWRFEPFPKDVSVLYVSGAPDREFLQRHRTGKMRFLQKPFRFHELIMNVQMLRQKPAVR